MELRWFGGHHFWIHGYIHCMLGLFGLSSFLAEKRGKEISIRKVFGSQWKEYLVIAF